MKKYLFLFITAPLFLSGCASKDYFQKCNHSETGGTSVPFSGTYEKHSFRPECAPDTLYSWQTEDKVNPSVFPLNPLRNSSYLYTWRTPLSTYAYGNVQIRLKLKPNTKFRWFIKNRGGPLFRCPQEDQDSTVYVLTTTYEKVVSEYVICSPEVLESWSIQTKGAYLEAENEMRFIQRHVKTEPQQFDAFGFGYNRTRLPPLNQHFSSDSYFVNWDGKTLKWSDEALALALHQLKVPTHPLKGQIFYGKNVATDPKRHFERKEEAYFKLSSSQLREALQK